MPTLLFHAEVFIPEEAKRPVHYGRLTYGRHARDEALSDRYGHIVLPSCFSPEQARLIESEYCPYSARVIKQVWRQRLDEQRDLVLVISSGGFVRTVWVNVRGDHHATLNKARYVSAFEWRSRYRAAGTNSRRH